MIVVMFGSDPSLTETAEELRRHGLVPVVASSKQAAIRLLEGSDLSLAVLFGTVAASEELVERLATRGVPTVIAADWATADWGTTRELAAVFLPAGATPGDICAAGLALLPRRQRIDAPVALECGPLILDLKQQVVSVEGTDVEIPPKEFAILRELILEDGRPISSEDLLQRVWRTEAIVTIDDVHRHVYRLRSAIGDHERSDPLVANRRGFGYAITQPVRVIEDSLNGVNRLRGLLRQSGAMSSLALIGSALALRRGRAARWRASFAEACSNIGICMEQAVAVLAGVLFVTALTTQSGPASPDLPSSAEFNRSSVTNVIAKNQRQGAPVHLDEQVVGLSLTDPVDAAHETQIWGGVHRDERGISVKHWVKTLVPGGPVEDDGDDVWMACGEGQVRRTACDTFDDLSRGSG